MSIRKYKSFGVDVFSLWKFVYLFLIGTTLILYYLGFAFFDSILFSLLITLCIVVIRLAMVWKTVSRLDSTIIISSLQSNQKIERYGQIESWWQYDFGNSLSNFDSGDIFSSSLQANKINIFLEISSKSETIVLKELIFLSSKTPNHHRYQQERIPLSKPILIWDIDKCVEVLDLE